jgi:hypothetical protein
LNRGKALIRRLLGPRSEPDEQGTDLPILLQRAVIVRYSGGLANQMLCYKLMRYLSDLNRCAAVIDATSYGRLDINHGRNFQLLKYPVRYDLLIFADDVIKTVRRSNTIRKITRAHLATLAPGDAPVLDEIAGADIVEGDLWLALRLRAAADAAAEENGSLIDLTLDFGLHASAQDRETLEWIRARETAVAIHVRRGDFAVHDGNLLLTTDYYNRAIARAESALPEPSFLVISDDIEWCKANLRTTRELHFVDHHNDQDGYKDMFLASQCRHFILSNESTFSHQMVQLSPFRHTAMVITSGPDDLVKNQ